jgi:hypothetical protein
MAVKRIKPNVRSDRFDESRAFYTDVVGLEQQDGLSDPGAAVKSMLRASTASSGPRR